MPSASASSRACLRRGRHCWCRRRRRRWSDARRRTARAKLRHREIDAAADRGAVGERARQFQQPVAESLRGLRPVDHRPVDHDCLIAEARPLHEHDRDAPVAAGADGVEHAAVGDRGGVAFALQLEFLSVDAARHVRRQHQQQIDRLGRARGGNGVPERRGQMQTECSRRIDPLRLESHGQLSRSCLLRQHARGRKGHLHQRAAVDLAGDAEAGMVGLGERLGDGQPEAGAARTPAHRGGELAERLERGLQFLLAHADAGVAHAQDHLVLVGERGGDDHLPAGAGELDRVRQQIERDLAHRTHIGDDLRQACRQRGADDDALAVGLLLHDGDALLHQVVEVHAHESELELCRLRSSTDRAGR